MHLVPRLLCACRVFAIRSMDKPGEGCWVFFHTIENMFSLMLTQFHYWMQKKRSHKFQQKKKRFQSTQNMHKKTTFLPHTLQTVSYCYTLCLHSTFRYFVTAKQTKDYITTYWKYSLEKLTISGESQEDYCRSSKRDNPGVSCVPCAITGCIQNMKRLFLEHLFLYLVFPFYENRIWIWKQTLDCFFLCYAKNRHQTWCIDHNGRGMPNHYTF